MNRLQKNKNKEIIIISVIYAIISFFIILFVKVNHDIFLYIFAFFIGLSPIYLSILQRTNLKILGLGKTRSEIKKETNKKYLIYLIKTVILLGIIVLYNIIIFGFDFDILILLNLYLLSLSITNTFLTFGINLKQGKIKDFILLITSILVIAIALVIYFVIKIKIMSIAIFIIYNCIMYFLRQKRFMLKSI